MNRKMTWAVACATLVLGVAMVSANEKAPEDYVKAMKAIGMVNGTMRQLAAAKDYAGLAKAAADLKGPAEVTAKFWTAKKVEDATKSSNDFVAGVAALDKAAGAKDDAAVTAAIAAIGGTCRTCHTAHRSEKLADGSYEIK